MDIRPERYMRKPLFVEAVRVTRENFHAMVQWCGGAIFSYYDDESGEAVPEKDHIKVRVNHPLNKRQTMAYVGDWILKTGHESFKVFTNKSFKASFKPVEMAESVVAVTPLDEALVEAKADLKQFNATDDAWVGQLPGDLEQVRNQD